MRAGRLALAAILLCGGAAPRAQEPAPDQSLNRMKSVLEKPPLRLELPDAQATFKVEIKAIHPLHEIFDKVPWATDPVGWQPPGVGLDLGLLFRYMATVKRAHDVRVAREDVQRQIADYCAVQPNANTIQICSTSPAIR
jgi:hypothetical protein